MFSGGNSGSPELLAQPASFGEWVFAEVMIEGVSDVAGVSEPSEAALNFILVAGLGGHHHHPVDNGLLPLPSGSGMVFLCAQRRQRAFGDWKLSKEIKFSNTKSGGRLKRALSVCGPAIDRSVASWHARRRAASDRIGGHRAIPFAATKHLECQLTRNEHVAPVEACLRLSGIDR